MLKYKIPQIVTLTRIHLPQIVLKKRILIANYLTIRILFGAANGIRTRDPQLGKLMLYRLSYFRITEYKVTPFFLFVKFSAAEKCAYPTIFFSDARFSGFFRLRPSAE